MEPPSPLNGPVSVASLTEYRIRCDLYCGPPKWLGIEAIDPCKRTASTSVVFRSQVADLQRVDQACLRGNMTLRQTMAHSPQGG